MKNNFKKQKPNIVNLSSIKTKIIFYILILQVIAISTLGILAVDYSKQTLVKETEKSLKELAKQGATITESRLDVDKKVLEVIAYRDIIKNMNLNEQIPALQQQIKNTNFLALGVVYPGGNTYYHDGTTANLGDREYVKKSI